jgi:hypothetical protein
MMIDVQQESEAVRERSLELAELLAGAVVVVDRTEIRQALAESKRLADAAAAARAEVGRRVARGEPPGAALGPVGPIRRVKTGPNGQDLDPVLLGRLVCSAELRQYWEHRFELAATIRAAYEQASEQCSRRPALLAAAYEHLSLLRRRRSFAAEGGEALQAAVGAFENLGPVIREGVAEAEEIRFRAEAALEDMRTAPTAAALEAEAGPVALFHAQQYLTGRISAAMGSVPIHSVTGAPIPVETEPADSRK